MYAETKRSCFSGGTWNAVSSMPSGSKIRSRRNSANDLPVARAISTPVDGEGMW